MKPPARVTSLDLLRDFRAALATFKADGQDALTANALDIRRAFDWLTERRQFWVPGRARMSGRSDHAKAELARKQVCIPGERKPDCTQEIKALRAGPGPAGTRRGASGEMSPMGAGVAAGGRRVRRPGPPAGRPVGRRPAQVARAHGAAGDGVWRNTSPVAPRPAPTSQPRHLTS